jgi:hypothetical protein
MHEHGTIKWTNVPRQPLPKLDDVSLWVGNQLNHERMPAKYQHMAPEGELIASLDGHPEGLLAIPGDNNGPPSQDNSTKKSDKSIGAAVS